MGKINQLSVGEQVMLIFGLIGAILVATGLFLFFSLRSIERHNEELQDQILHEWKLDNDLSHNLSLEQIEVYRHVQTADREDLKRLDQVISEMKKANAKRLNDYGKLADNETETRLCAKAVKAQE